MASSAAVQPQPQPLAPNSLCEQPSCVAREYIVIVVSCTEPVETARRLYTAWLSKLGSSQLNLHCPLVHLFPGSRAIWQAAVG